ncbi:MAG TPA: hypothetical protein VI542_07090 [Candidatus Tectomicrobia bacterium]
MPKKNAHAMGEPLMSLTGRFPVSVVARIDAHAEAMRRAMPGLSIGRSDVLRSLVVQALDALYGPTANAVMVTDTVTDTSTDTHGYPVPEGAMDHQGEHVTDTVTDTSAQTEDEQVAIRALQGVTDTITDTERVTDTVTVTGQAREPFDEARYYLGKLCPKGHDFDGTGQSLLRKHNQRCRECENESRREERARRKVAREAVTS